MSYCGRNLLSKFVVVLLEVKFVLILKELYYACLAYWIDIAYDATYIYLTLAMIFLQNKTN